MKTYSKVKKSREIGENAIASDEETIHSAGGRRTFPFETVFFSLIHVLLEIHSESACIIQLNLIALALSPSDPVRGSLIGWRHQRLLCATLFLLNIFIVQFILPFIPFRICAFRKLRHLPQKRDTFYFSFLPYAVTAVWNLR